MPEQDRAETGDEGIRCKRCGANLSGLEPSANCPACGSAIGISLPAGYDRGTKIPELLTPPDLCCTRCGESLSNVPRSSHCPNCKLPIKQSLSQGNWTSAVGAAGVVESDAACRKCGYNLRGLPDSGNCPECGTTVALSIRGDFLCYADPVWSRKIARGSLWISRGMISMVAALPVGCCFSIGLAANAGWVAIIPFAIGVLAFLGGLLLQYIGTWIITTPDPASPPHATGVTARKLIRIGLFVTIVDSCEDMIVQNAGVPRAVWIASTILDIPFAALSVIVTVAYFGYLAKLTARIPNDDLTRRASSLKLWFALGLGIVSLVGTVEMLYEVLVQGAPQTGFSAPTTAVAARPWFLNVFSIGLGLVGGLIMLISVVRTIGLQWQFATAAREQAKQAEANWSGTQTAPTVDE